MKKRLLAMVSVIVLGLTLVPVNAYAANPVRVVVNNRTISFPDAVPFVDGSGRVQVPVRFMSETLGATVDWEQETQKVTVKRAKNIAVLTIGSKYITINGKAKVFDTGAILKDTRTFVPIRFVSEALGATVEWEEETYTVNISMEKTGAMINDNGFMVPDDTKIMITTGNGETTEVQIYMSTTYGEWEKMKKEMKYALEQKFGAGIANEVINYIDIQQDEKGYMLRKIIYVESTDQELQIAYTKGENAEIRVSFPGYKYSQE